MNRRSRLDNQTNQNLYNINSETEDINMETLSNLENEKIYEGRNSRRTTRNRTEEKIKETIKRENISLRNFNNTSNRSKSKQQSKNNLEKKTTNNNLKNSNSKAKIEEKKIVNSKNSKNNRGKTTGKSTKNVPNRKKSNTRKLFQNNPREKLISFYNYVYRILISCYICEGVPA